MVMLMGMIVIVCLIVNMGMSMIVIMIMIVSARCLKTAAISTNENLIVATFKLNSSMINPIFFPPEEIVKQMQDMSALALGQVINQNVARESRQTAGDTPDM